MNEKQFYDALANVPDVPSGMLENIERSVRRSGVKRRASLAACLLLAFIIPALLLRSSSPSTAYADQYELMDELMYAFEFLGGGDSGGDYLLEADCDNEATSGSGAESADAGAQAHTEEISMTDTNASARNVSANNTREGASK